jgi:hypothetical protein
MRRTNSVEMETYLVKHYFPSCFLYKVEATMVKTLFMLFNCFYQIIVHESNTEHARFMHDLIFKLMADSSESFHFIFCTDILDGAQFAIHTLNK